MGVTTTQTNKPFNPRGNDQSPKGYNKASLFSGKALDFDGVNDKLTTPNISVQSSNVWTYSFNLKKDPSNVQYVFDARTTGGDGYTSFFNTANELIFYDSESGGGSRKFNLSFENYIWYFFTMVSNGDDVKLYINGIYVDFVDGFNSIASSNDLYIGSRYSTSDFYNGQIAGFKTFDVALTAAQVADLYNNPEKVVPTGVDNTALKLWLPMMEGAGTTAYNGAPDALGSNVVTNGTFDTDSDWNKGTGWSIGSGKATRSGASSNTFIGQDFNVVSGTTYILKYNRTYISGGGETNAYSYFDGSTSRVTRGQYIGTAQETVTVLDTFTPTFSGNLAFRFYGIGTFTGSIDNIEIKPISGIGTISGATWTHGIGAPVAQTSVIDWNKIQAKTNGGTLSEPLIPQGLTSGRDLLGNLFENVRKQGALNLDGNSWAEVHDNESLDITSAITLECWVYWDGTSSDDGILGKWGDISSDRCYMLYGDPNKLYFYISSNSIFEEGITTGWRHIVGTYDKVNTKIYIDGQQENSSTAISTDIPTNSKPLEIGTYRYTGSRNYKHQIAQPRIYNRALTASEIQQNYNAGKNTYTN